MKAPRKTAYVPDGQRHTSAVKVRLDPELAARLRAYARKEGLELSAIVGAAIEEYLPEP